MHEHMLQVGCSPFTTQPQRPDRVCNTNLAAYKYRSKAVLGHHAGHLVLCHGQYYSGEDMGSIGKEVGRLAFGTGPKNSFKLMASPP